MDPEAAVEVLVVDDDRSACRTIVRILNKGGYTSAVAFSAAEAREKVEALSPKLILSDVDMPGESGIDLLTTLAPREPELAIVMVTGLNDREIAEKALEIGAYGYVIKPFEGNEILISVSNALRRRDLEIANRAHTEDLEQRVQARTSHLWDALRDLESAQAEIRASQEKTISKLAIAAEYRDVETGDHIERMSRYCALLASKVGLEDERIRLIKTASIMHDVGKIAIPDDILLKPGPLDENELHVMRTHAEIGHRILQDDAPLLQLAASIALTHHEWFDGTGYPAGLAGDEIPIEGRLAAVADVFDALTSNRPYRRAFSLGETVEMMRQESGRHFQPDLLDAFFDSLDELVVIAHTPTQETVGSTS